jgi:transcriptional regulator with XRE-family HTH domain
MREDNASVNDLRGIVYAMYGNLSNFAKALGWSRQKVARIINQGQKPSAQDMEQMADCLKVKDVYTFVHIFLPSLSTKCIPEIPEPYRF